MFIVPKMADWESHLTKTSEQTFDIVVEEQKS